MPREPPVISACFPLRDISTSLTAWLNFESIQSRVSLTDPPIQTLLRPYCKITHGHPHELSVHLTKRLVELNQFSAAQLQCMLIRLIDCSDSVVQVRGSRVFDVIPENMRHYFILREIYETLDAMDELNLIFHVKPSRVQRISSKQYSCLSIIDCNAGRFVTRDRYHINNSI